MMHLLLVDYYYHCITGKEYGIGCDVSKVGVGGDLGVEGAVVAAFEGTKLDFPGRSGSRRDSGK
jgi:hypothetical protein